MLNHFHNVVRILHGTQGTRTVINMRKKHWEGRHQLWKKNKEMDDNNYEKNQGQRRQQPWTRTVTTTTTTMKKKPWQRRQQLWQRNRDNDDNNYEKETVTTTTTTMKKKQWQRRQQLWKRNSDNDDNNCDKGTGTRTIPTMKKEQGKESQKIGWKRLWFRTTLNKSKNQRIGIGNRA